MSATPGPSPHPGGVRRLGLRLYRLLPPGVGYALVRTVQPTFSVGAVVLLEFEGKVLALRQEHRSGYSLPGGLVDRGERPEGAARREVMEETGIAVDPGDPITVAFAPRLRHCDVIFRVPCETEPDVRVGSEAISHAWLALDDWPEADGATRRVLDAVRAAALEPRIGCLL